MRKNSSSSLFLMELIIAILFFSLASTVCIQLFVKAHLLTEKSVNLNQSILWTQNLAEGFLNSNGDLAGMKELFDEKSELGEDHISLYFDSDWNPVAAGTDSARYEVKLQLTATDTSLVTAQIVSTDLKQTAETEPIYSLTVDKFVGNGGAL